MKLVTTINEWKKYILESNSTFNYDQADLFINKAMIEYSHELYQLREMYDSNFDEYSEEYKEWCYDELYDMYNNCIDDIYDCIENEKIVYRVISVDKTFTIEDIIKNGLGIYWSYDEKAAQAHWGYGKGIEIKLIGKIINTNSIDFNATIMANLHPTLGSDEKEITFKKDSEIKLISIETNDDIIDVNRIFKI